MSSVNLSAVLNYAVSSVFALEAALPQAGFGKTKKSIALGAIEALLKATKIETGALASSGSNVGTNTEISLITGAASDFIDATVAAMNKTSKPAS